MNRTNPKAGILPLYLELYDQIRAETRDEFAPLIETICARFHAHGVETSQAAICRVKSEFEAAVRGLEAAGADLIVTVHLSYSPSLESIDALADTALPILVLDTTMDAGFGQGVDPSRIMYNHGIHGVMDMANLLRRRGKHFEVVAGHAGDDALYARAAEFARAAVAAKRMHGGKALRLGEAFAGMGDFVVGDEALSGRFGLAAETADLDALEAAAAGVSEEAIEEEFARDCKAFEVIAPKEAHRISLRTGLGLRAMLEDGGYTAFSMNFRIFDREEGPACTVPFLEASKAMARGIGYAGEGDVLTANLVGALAGGFGEATFTEIFCPDWQGDSLFLSHMGEINPEVAGARPLLFEKEYPFSPARNPACIACAPKAGPAVYVNLAPQPENGFLLILAPVEILGDTHRADMRQTVRGWMRPACGIRRFLEENSCFGGTHHSALVLGDRLEALAAFGRYAGLEVCAIG